MSTDTPHEPPVNVSSAVPTGRACCMQPTCICADDCACGGTLGSRRGR